MSDKAATSEAARWLARRQNQSDLLGGVSLREHGGTLASLLMDLQQAATMDSSLILADYVLGNMGQLGRLHKKQVQQAGFMVLRSPALLAAVVVYSEALSLFGVEISYLQMLGTLVDFSTFNPDASR